MKLTFGLTQLCQPVRPREFRQTWLILPV
ncbi:unnamed protein product, partial [Vitis vinifera]|uniref:Uncharacterized protein n=1 Tax=Vitis vinifera TaxID=29760 RepID=D7TTM9_VITVI